MVDLISFCIHNGQQSFICKQSECSEIQLPLVSLCKMMTLCIKNASPQVEVPLRLGGAAADGGAAAVLQDRAHGLHPAALLQRLPVQAVLRHPWLVLPGEAQL